MGKLILLYFLPVLMLTGCGSDPPAGGFDDALAQINVTHAEQTQKERDLDIEDYICDTDSPDYRDSEFSEEELEALTHYSQAGKNAVMTAAQARDDVELAFRLWKTDYGCYGYFGRDAFERARENVLAGIDSAGDRIDSMALENLLLKNLGFVRDGHFLIGGQTVFPRSGWYSNEELEFRKDGRGYFTAAYGGSRYVTAVNGADPPENWMQFSISDEGELVYRLGTLSEDPISQVDVSFEDGTEAVSLAPSGSISYDRNTVFCESETDGIPIVAVRSFAQTYNENMIGFVKTADTIKDSPVAVLDLRENGGGRTNFVTSWLNRYDPALKYMAYGSAYASLSTSEQAYFLAQYAHDQGYLSNSEIEYLMTTFYKNEEASWAVTTNPAFVQCPNDGILFVLVDQYTGSASEHLVSALLNKENVIFVGTNTGGRLLGEQSINVVLPNSHIFLQCGDSLNFYYDDTVFTESTGFSPDIWVSGDSLESTLRLIRGYHLGPTR
jgi:hypothetical protein